MSDTNQTGVPTNAGGLAEGEGMNPVDPSVTTQTAGGGLYSETFLSCVRASPGRDASCSWWLRDQMGKRGSPEKALWLQNVTARESLLPEISLHLGSYHREESVSANESLH